MESLKKCVAEHVTENKKNTLLYLDANPENILIDEHDKIYLMNYNLYNSKDKKAEYYSYEEAKIKRKMPGARITEKSNVFLFGSLLYRCMQGLFPWSGGTDEQILDKILNLQPESGKVTLKQFGDGVHPLLKCICYKALRIGDGRYEKVDEILEDWNLFKPVKAVFDVHGEEKEQDADDYFDKSSYILKHKNFSHYGYMSISEIQYRSEKIEEENGKIYWLHKVKPDNKYFRYQIFDENKGEVFSEALEVQENIKKLTKISHTVPSSGIPKVKAYRISSKGAEYITECVEGKSFEKILWSWEYLSQNKVQSYMKTIAEKLGKLHQNDFYHLNINTHNIIVGPESKKELSFINFDVYRSSKDSGTLSAYYINYLKGSQANKYLRMEMVSLGSLMNRCLHSGLVNYMRWGISLPSNYLNKLFSYFNLDFLLAETPIASDLENIYGQLLKAGWQKKLEYTSMDDVALALEKAEVKDVVPGIITNDQKKSIIRGLQGMVLVFLGSITLDFIHNSESEAPEKVVVIPDDPGEGEKGVDNISGEESKEIEKINKRIEGLDFPGYLPIITYNNFSSEMEESKKTIREIEEQINSLSKKKTLYLKLYKRVYNRLYNEAKLHGEEIQSETDFGNTNQDVGVVNYINRYYDILQAYEIIHTNQKIKIINNEIKSNYDFYSWYGYTSDLKDNKFSCYYYDYENKQYYMIEAKCNTGKQKQSPIFKLDELGNRYKLEKSHKVYKSEEPGEVYKLEKSGKVYKLEKSGEVYKLEELDEVYKLEESGEAYKLEEPGKEYYNYLDEIYYIMSKRKEYKSTKDEDSSKQEDNESNKYKGIMERIGERIYVKESLVASNYVSDEFEEFKKYTEERKKKIDKMMEKEQGNNFFK